MTPDDAFLADIIEHPDDDSLRLIYADYLEEHGQPDRAALIRTQCELAGLPDGPRRLELEARERALLEEHGEEWVGPLRGLIESGQSRGGWFCRHPRVDHRGRRRGRKASHEVRSTTTRQKLESDMPEPNDSDGPTPPLPQAILRHLTGDDEPNLWAAVLDVVFKDAGALCRGGMAGRPAVALVGRCSHWLRPHQTRWTADGGFAWPSGYLGRPYSRTGLPELDWSVAFALDQPRSTWRPAAMPPSRDALVLRVAVPARTARHRRAAVHTVWTPGSPVRPRVEAVQFYGFRKKNGLWDCTAYRGDEGMYEAAADHAGSPS
jgi:uncharacterized protein (TIGR02996 family)